MQNFVSSRSHLKRFLDHFSFQNLDVFVLVYALFFAACSVLLTGYDVYTDNQAIQLPLVRLLKDSSLYANDAFAATLPQYASVVWQFVALLNQAIPLEPLLLVLFLFERFLVIYAAGYLARTFAPQSKLAIFGSMVLFSLEPTSILASGTIVRSYFEQTGFFIPFFLLATAALYQGRPLLWAVLIAIGFNLNSMYGVYALTYFAALFVFDANLRRHWKKWLLAFGVFMLFASPGILLTFSAIKKGTLDTELWLTATEMRFPHHLYPLSWSRVAFLKFGLLALSLLTYLYYTKQHLPRLFKHSFIWVGISLLWLLNAFVAAYVVKSPSLLVTHSGRATDLLCCFAGIALVSACAINIENNSSQGRLIGATVVATSVLICLTPVLMMRSIKLYLTVVLIVSVIVLALWRVSWDKVLGAGSLRRISSILTIWFLLVTGNSLISRIKHKGEIHQALIDGPPAEVQQIADWAKEHTATDALFLVHPDDQGQEWRHFRAISERPVFITWADGSAILWQRSFVNQWTERLAALGFNIKQQRQKLKNLRESRALTRSELNRLYENLSDDQVQKLTRNYPISYWVISSEKRSSFPIAYQTSHYKVLAIRP
jgi:hypothetical protein